MKDQSLQSSKVPSMRTSLTGSATLETLAESDSKLEPAIHILSGWVGGWLVNVILDPTLALQIQTWIQNPSSSRVWQLN